jgi:UDP-N-acetylmuramate dehydrogenase
MPLFPSTFAQLSALDVKEDEPLVRKTWWRVGGPADGYVEVSTLSELQTAARACHSTGCPLFVLGNASNVLIADRGVRGLVVRLRGELADTERTGNTLRVGGGAKLVSLVRKVPKEGWTGLEMLAGVPGTMGGAVKMNAGTRLGEISDVLVSVGLVMPDGSKRTVPRDKLPMRYRHGGLPEGAIVAWATVRVGSRTAGESKALIDEHLAYRAETQPVDVPTCGSTFRNPDGDSAGRLIESCGLKGYRVGGARVSEKHANFIENTGGATAIDIRRLINEVQTTVWRQRKVLLDPEVKFVGDWSDFDPEATL